MGNIEDIYRKNLFWLLNTLTMPDVITGEMFNDRFVSGEVKDLDISKWFGVTYVPILQDALKVGLFPIMPNMKYPPIVKAFVVPFESYPHIDRLPSIDDLKFKSLISSDKVICLVSNKPKYPIGASVRCVILPDIRDLERLIFGEEEWDFTKDIEGRPLADQLHQEITEARQCKEANLPIATIATLAIAMETACKMILEEKQIRYSPTKDGLNDLLNHLTRNGLMSEKDKQAFLSLKGVRNAVDHSHTGLVTNQNAELFFATGEDLIRRLLKSSVHDGSA